MAAIQAHQVVVVCGETGSGKTTQLPKMAMALGRGQQSHGKRQRIGHTQPRRIAASSIARRIASELDTTVGQIVGYQVRFADRVGKDTILKLMTDGILLAETQSDPLLRAYDTLLIDEAHERTLNIDFLLGYLRRILPQRPDLKVIVTSATLDAQRFAEHFALSPPGGGALIPAPVITVPGRSFAVEYRYRPFTSTKDHDWTDAIADAVDELWAPIHQAGDILVFLPGEREIREASDHLRAYVARKPIWGHTEVLPLYSRMGSDEQDRIFCEHHHRRIVLATNVAETSLTVPGIRHVIDIGTARVKRYSYRNKVEQLLVEPISQAAAMQRAGRCGRVADGVCIRLYDEASLLQRPRYTDPEMLRSSLASVILRMKSLGLGAVEDFPFLDQPSGRSIADGYQLLQELGAVDERNALTDTGRTLAKLPLDPRVGRILLEAQSRQALAEVLVIASALSVQDVRERPAHAAPAADRAHARFDDERSEFTGYLTLWHWLHEQRGDGKTRHKLSQRKYEQLLREHFLHTRRVREWIDVHSQLLTVATEHRWLLSTSPASYEQIHLSLLAGFLGNLGVKLTKDKDAGSYLGARGIKFLPHPGARLRKKPGSWIVAAELMETTKLYARTLATIDPQWIEIVGAHLLQKQVLDPQWDEHSAQVIALERATLYGLVVYSGRKVRYATTDPAGAREIFLREALVAGRWNNTLAFLAANQRLIQDIAKLEHKQRRQDVLVDDEVIFAFYDRHVPQDVCSGSTFESWYRDAVRLNADVLKLTRSELMRHEAASVTSTNYPRYLRLGGVDCAARYLHDPGHPADGMSVDVPVFVLNQVQEARCEWLVPGMLEEKVLALAKTLPQRVRARLVPVPQWAQKTAMELAAPEFFGQGSLLDAVLKKVHTDTSFAVQRSDLRLEAMPAHLLMHFRIMDEHGRVIDQGRCLASLKAAWKDQARSAFQALASLRSTVPTCTAPHTGNDAPRQSTRGTSAPSPSTSSVPTTMDAEIRYTTWAFGELPEMLEVHKKGVQLIGYPALIDAGEFVTIEVFDEAGIAQKKHREGLRRLVALQIGALLKTLDKRLPPSMDRSLFTLLQHKLAAEWGLTKSVEELRPQIMAVAIDRAFLQGPQPTNPEEFQVVLEQGKGRLALVHQEVCKQCLVILEECTIVLRKVRDGAYPTDTLQDIRRQLGHLLHKHFLVETQWEALQHFPRYLRGMALRLDKCKDDPARDQERTKEIWAVESRYWKTVQERGGPTEGRLLDYRWMLEELRIGLFAQELRTAYPVSVKRLEKTWVQIR
ncbi:ATP-dependent helicase HrpA [Candidatus Symbiobacter mobilis CR]|uniref:ATP-dependent helicase HrpA n=2 Tax=Candidatus Symbiobacter TaxID=1436289 RepID=U5N5I2_9BURK|nr:ATP-dependent helicase HrpA [Candidatus Symbiobacter mobilis CR]